MDAFYLALLLYFAAVVLAFVDLFIPSGGLLVALAVVAAFASVLFGFRSSTTMGMGMLTLVVASVPAFAFAAIKIWPRTPLGRRIILGLPVAKTQETGSEPDPLNALVGQVMIAEYALMPTGQIRVGHRRLNAVVESGGIVEAGERIKVVAIRENNLVVRATSEPLTASVKPAPDGAAPNPASAEPQSLLDRPAQELGLDSLDD